MSRPRSLRALTLAAESPSIPTQELTPNREEIFLLGGVATFWRTTAQASYPNRQVISMSGDGGFAMLMGDLLTLRQHKSPVKLIVFKNDSLAFVELEMKAGGILDFATDLHNPDFAKIAEGAGLLGLRADSPEQVEPMLSAALQHDGPALVEVPVSRQELSMPPTTTLEQAKGFSLFMMKAVLNGRVDEIIDLASVNLFR